MPSKYVRGATKAETDAVRGGLLVDLANLVSPPTPWTSTRRACRGATRPAPQRPTRSRSQLPREHPTMIRFQLSRDELAADKFTRKRESIVGVGRYSSPRGPGRTSSFERLADGDGPRHAALVNPDSRGTPRQGAIVTNPSRTTACRKTYLNPPVRAQRRKSWRHSSARRRRLSLIAQPHSDGGQNGSRVGRKASLRRGTAWASGGAAPLAPNRSMPKSTTAARH